MNYLLINLWPAYSAFVCPSVPDGNDFVRIPQDIGFAVDVVVAKWRTETFRSATAGCACALWNARSYTCALVWILTETVFERSASVDTIRVSASVTVTVESKQPTWTNQSVCQRYLRVGCQLTVTVTRVRIHTPTKGTAIWPSRSPTQPHGEYESCCVST